MNSLFVYGTLQQTEVQQKVVGRKVISVSARLPGFTKDTVVIHGKCYPIAIPSASDTIDGQVLEVTDDELKKLDEYETDAYARLRVELENKRIVWVYCKP